MTLVASCPRLESGLLFWGEHSPLGCHNTRECSFRNPDGACAIARPRPCRSMLRTRRFAGGEKVRCQMPLHPRQLKFPVGVASTPGLHPNCASPPPGQAGEEVYWRGYAGDVDAYPNKPASYNLEAEQVTLPYVVIGNSIDLHQGDAANVPSKVLKTARILEAELCRARACLRD